MTSVPYRLNHTVILVRDLEAAAAVHVQGHGFEVVGDSSDASNGPGVLLRQGNILLVLVQPADRRRERLLELHGDFVYDLALRCSDPQMLIEQVLAGGGSRVDGEPSAVAGFGSLQHSVVPAIDQGIHVPGFDLVPWESGTPAMGLREVDHVAACLPAGQLEKTASRYQETLSLDGVYEERIEIGQQAMRSKVIRDPSSTLTFTFLEPDATAQPGQIDRFIDSNQGAGVQHLAFSCDDIIVAVSSMEQRGVEFLQTPSAYYRRVAAFDRQLAHAVEELESTNVLVDADERGEMFQIFARSVHERDTLFMELIERAGADTFGSNNIRALYESVQADRG